MKHRKTLIMLAYVGGLIILTLARSGLFTERHFVPQRDFDLSPDDKQVVYSTINGDLRLLDIASGRSRTLDIPLAPRDRCSPTYSPDGKSIAFSAASDLWLTSLDGQTARRLTHDKDFSMFSPSFSPDGKSLVFVRATNNYLSPSSMWWIEYDIWEIHTDGTDLRQLTQCKYRTIDQPQYRPDNGNVIFAATVSTDDRGGKRQALFEVDADAKQPPRELFGPDPYGGGAYLHEPSLSPDGQRITLISDHATPNDYAVCLLSRSGSSFRYVGLTGRSDDYQLHNREPHFSRDGTLIYYLADDVLMRVGVDGTNIQRVVSLTSHEDAS